MQPSSNLKEKLTFLCGSYNELVSLYKVKALKPFDEKIMSFLQDLSSIILKSNDAKAYPDVYTFGFYLRKGNLEKLYKEHFALKIQNRNNVIYKGRGVAFHIAPSNVPVNFAYTLFCGLITGNCNVVRCSSKDFAQVDIICKCINDTLLEHQDLKPYIQVVKYEADKEVNDYLSSICNLRVIWGGDITISKLRESPLQPRSKEITFADRYSIAIINSDDYLKSENKAKIAQDFYNDTYLTDQNACTSPRLIVWTGSNKCQAQDEFYTNLYMLVKTKYQITAIQAMNKLTSSYLVAASFDGVEVVKSSDKAIDNLITRVRLQSLDNDLMNYKDNSGYFFEYETNELEEIIPALDNVKCQTVAILGKIDGLDNVLSFVSGVDRVVSIGHTMDFDLIWDGYDLVDEMTRKIYSLG